MGGCGSRDSDYWETGQSTTHYGWDSDGQRGSRYDDDGRYEGPEYDEDGGGTGGGNNAAAEEEDSEDEHEEDDDDDTGMNGESDDEETRETFYHYTTPQAAADIIRSGMLIKSSKTRSQGRDAVFGDGVYLTKIPPTQPKQQIAINNWDGGIDTAEKIIHLGKVNACIQLRLDPRRVQKVDDPMNRDIYLFHGHLAITSDMQAVGYIVDKN